MSNNAIKQKRCKSCNDPFIPRNTLQKVCCAACALNHAQGIREKAFKSETAKRKKALLENDTVFLKARAQKVFNEFIRMRDASLGCVSCDKGPSWNGQWHAGHYKTVGARPDLRFSELNAHKQCSVCNNYLSGNLAEYRKNLILRIGIEEVGNIELDREIVAYRAKDYKDIYEKYKLKIKALRNEQ